MVGGGGSRLHPEGLSALVQITSLGVGQRWWHPPERLPERPTCSPAHLTAFLALTPTPVPSLLPLHAVTVYCITSGTVSSIQVKQISGKNWEAAVAESGILGLA